MRRYEQLTLEERERMYGMREKGMSLRGIAKKLGRSHTSLSRELKRNAKYGAAYLPARAEKKAQKRLFRQRRRAPLKNSTVYLYVREHLREPYRWSPEQIAARLSMDYPQEKIGVETIYRYVYRRTKTKEKLWQYLPYARRKRMKKEGRRVARAGKISEAVSIDERPDEVARRISIGHWETDNVIGKQTDTGALSVTVERVMRLTLLSKLSDRKAETKTEALIGRLSEIPKHLRRTITTDNGKENSRHKEVASALDVSMYFAHAYHSWEKGTVENMNGRIRKFLPKGKSLDDLSDTELRAIEQRLNTTPRKCLGFLTPYEKLQEVLQSSV